MSRATSRIVEHANFRVSGPTKTGSSLWFQKVTYEFADDAYQQASGMDSAQGFRFVWVQKDGRIQPTRGYERIPTLAELSFALAKAIELGWATWGDNSGGIFSA
jgi:hypothetical protein